MVCSPYNFGWLAGQDLLGGLLLLLVVVGVTDQPVTHPVQHVHNVAKRGVHLAHGVVGGDLCGPTPAGTGDVRRGGPHLARLILHRLRVHIESARHRPHLMRISHKTCGHPTISCSEKSFVGWLLRLRKSKLMSPLSATQ